MHVLGEGREFASAKEAIETYRAESGVVDQDLLDSLLRRMESRSVRSRMETVSFCSTSVVTVHRKSLWRLTEMTALTSLTVSECRR